MVVIVPRLDRADQLRVLLDPLLLRADEQEVEDREEERKEDELTHTRCSERSRGIGVRL